MAPSEYKISIAPPTASKLQTSQTNRDFCETLGRRLRQSGRMTEANQLQIASQDKSAMDFGTVIIAVLAAPAVVEAVKAISDYLKSLAPKDRRVIVEHAGKRIDLTNPSNEELNLAFRSFNG